MRELRDLQDVTILDVQPAGSREYGSVPGTYDCMAVSIRQDVLQRCQCCPLNALRGLSQVTIWKNKYVLGAIWLAFFAKRCKTLSAWRLIQVY